MRAADAQATVPHVAAWQDVRERALALPQTSERSSRGNCQWRVREKLFVWERPLRAREVQELGAVAPQGPVLGARVENLIVKQALLACEPELFFTSSHFDGVAAVLVRLERIGARELDEVVLEAWLARAPPRLAGEYERGRGAR